MDFRIKRSAVENVNEGTFFWRVIEKVWPRDERGDELKRIAIGTPGQQAIYIVTLFTREVCNGGLWQFFYNSSGMYADQVEVAFRKLDEENRADAYRKAIGAFPAQLVSTDRELRIAALESIPKQRVKEVFGAEERHLFDERALWPFFRKYIDAHPEEFFLD